VSFVVHPLAHFARALQDAEYSDDAATLNVTVRYRHDDSDYMAFPFPRGEYILADGIRDPGFGSGPIAFSDVEWVRVERSPRHGPSTEAYRRKLEKLVAVTKDLQGVSLTDGAVLFRNDT
jgi:hypothetical protein